MKNSSQIVVVGGLLSTVLLGSHAWYFSTFAVVMADALVLIALVASWAYLLTQRGDNQEVDAFVNTTASNSQNGSFIKESNAFHMQLGSEISGQLTSANTELGNTQVILSDAISKLVSNFIVISDEVHNLSGNTDKFSKQVHELVNDVTSSLRLAERFLDGLTSNDPATVRQSEAHIHSMIESIAEFNDAVTQNAVELNLTSGKVEQNVLVVISSLQFQDMSSQLIEHARMRMTALQEVANEMSKQVDNPNSREYMERITAYNRLLDKHVVSLDKQKANPVAQKDSSSGDIELF
jgi:methyl-accepting chemotaxis protein